MTVVSLAFSAIPTGANAPVKEIWTKQAIVTSPFLILDAGSSALGLKVLLAQRRTVQHYALRRSKSGARLCYEASTRCYAYSRPSPPITRGMSNLGSWIRFPITSLTEHSTLNQIHLHTMHVIPVYRLGIDDTVRKLLVQY